MSYKHISVAETHDWLEKPDVVIADIRDPNSFQAGHIPGAVHLSNANLAEFMMHREFDQPIIVVCYHGNSSQGAAGYLVEQGFEDVYSMDGGFAAWSLQYQDKIAR